MISKDPVVEYEKLKPYLTEKQVAFLEERRCVSTDKEAFKNAGVAYQNLPRWKRNDSFLAAYTLVSAVLAPPEDKLLVTGSDLETLKSSQLDSLSRALPRAVRELIRMVEHGMRDADRLAAIKELFSLTGFGPENTMPVTKQSQVFLNVLALVSPQIAAEAQKRNLPVPAATREAVEASWRELESELSTDEEE